MTAETYQPGRTPDTQVISHKLDSDRKHSDPCEPALSLTIGSEVGKGTQPPHNMLGEHYYLPADAIADFLDLQTDLRVCVDVLSLHSLSGEEVKFFSIVGVMHRHNVGPVIARATQMAKTLSL